MKSTNITLLKLLEKSTEFLVGEESAVNNPSLINGCAGKLLALTYLQCYYNKSDIKDKLSNSIESSFDSLISALSDTEMNGSLYYGVTGIAYVIRTMQALKCLKIEDKDLNLWIKELDKEIEASFIESLSLQDYDLLRGAIGHCIYYLTFNFREDLVCLFLDSINKLLIKDSAGGYYANSYIYDSEVGTIIPDKEKINLGLAHGIPSLATILIKIAKNYPKYANKCKHCIEGILNWIVHQKINSDFCDFPHFVFLNQSSNDFAPKNDSFSRLAWCYGDLGILVPFIAYKEINPNFDLSDVYQTLKKVTTLRNEKNSYVEDFGFCHGYVGVLYLLKAIEKEKPLNKFWLNQLEANLNFDYSPTGMYETEYDELNNGKGAKVATAGFLEGHSGIVLTLLDLLYQTPMYWSNLFLL